MSSFAGYLSVVTGSSQRRNSPMSSVRLVPALVITVVAAASAQQPVPQPPTTPPAGVAPAIAAETPASDSLRSDAEIREVVMRHAASVRQCYEQEGLRRNATLHGTLELEIVILPVGRVSAATVRKSAMRGEGAREVAECIEAAARNWRFTRGPFATDVILLPFTLIPKTASLRSPDNHT